MDLAPLQFSIDSSGAVSATQALDAMVRSSTETTRAVRTLAESSTSTTSALRDLAQQSVLTDQALRQAGTGIDGLISKVQLLSREIGTFQATTRDMQTALGQLRAAGELFGTSAAGLDSFARASRAVGQNSFEMVQSLQRIQQALEGTTQAGQRAREVLRNYGIEVQGLRPEDAGDVLRRFVSARNSYASDSRRNEDDSAVLGRMSIETLASIGGSDYRTEAQRRREAETSVSTPRFLQTEQSISERSSAVARRRSEREDLTGEYRDFSDRWRSVSLDDLRRRRDGGLYVPRSSEFGWTENADGTASFQHSARPWERLFNTFVPGAGEGFVGGYWRGLSSRGSSDGYRLNQREIQQRSDEELEDSLASGRLFGTEGGWLGRTYRWGQRSLDNRFGGYRPNMETVQRFGLQRTANFDYATDTLGFVGALSPAERQQQQWLVQAAQEFGPGVYNPDFGRMRPTDILSQMPEWARDSAQRRLDVLDRNMGLGNDRLRGDSGLMRRASLGGLGRDDLFGLDPDQLGLTTDTTTNQEAAERARKIAQAVLRIRETFTGIDRQREELEKVNRELDADAAARQRTANDQSAAALAFSRRTAGLLTDVNPLNRAQNAGQLAYERALQSDPGNQTGAMLAGQRALTDALISLERVMNEAVRQSQIALGSAVGNFNAYVGNSAIPRFSGGPELGGEGVFRPRSMPGASSLGTNEAMQGIIAAIQAEFPGVRLTSGLRPNAGTSQHTHGNAADFNLEGLDPEQRAALFRFVTSGTGAMAGVGGLGTYDASGRSFHVDARTGQRMAWGPSRGRDSLGSTPQAFQDAVRAWMAGGGARPGAIALPELGVVGDPVSAGGVGIPSLTGWRPATTVAEVYRRQNNRNLEAAAVGQTRNLPNGPGREEAIGNFIDEGAVQAMARLARAFDEGTASHLNNTEALRASTSAERELIQARQGAERQEATIRATAAQARDPSLRAQLNGLADLQVPTALSRTLGTQGDRFDGSLRTQRLNLADAEAENDNWYLTNSERARLRGERSALRAANDAGFAPGSARSNEAVGLAGRTSELNELARQNQLIRDSFLDMGNAATNALSQIIVRGGDARQVLSAMLADLAAVGLRRAGTVAAEGALSWIGRQIFGGGGGAAGSAVTYAGPSVGTISPGSGFLTAGAQGYAFTRAFASGEVVDKPTYFPMADGNRGLAGEAGRPEAILPLQRDANGNLGVAASGSGGGGHTISVVVHNNGGQGTNPDQAKTIAALVAKAIDEGNQKNMLEQMRVGGHLNPLYGGMRG